MSDFIFHDLLEDIYDKTPVLPLTDRSKIVIFSDLHLGDGGSNDDFLKNSEMFFQAAEEHYLAEGYRLVLNGDIEELQRFRLAAIERQWPRFYELMRAFERETALYKTVGNHDFELFSLRQPRYPYDICEAVRFGYHNNDIFVVHGHQASSFLTKRHRLNTYVLRYLANPLRISNRSVAHDSRKRYRVERRIYDFSSSKKMITVIGHTHRPLFESHSKIDELKFRIERHLRKYTGSGKRKQQKIREEVAEYKQALARLYAAEDGESIQSNLYNELVVPSIFNSGCVIGKRGMTGIEIDRGEIRLVHWFDSNRSERHLIDADVAPYRLPGTTFHRTVLKSDSLDYIFARIQLLA